MRLKSLKNGVQISAEIRIDSPLESHQGIATYLGSHDRHGHVLVHIFSEVDDALDTPLDILTHAASFYKDYLGIPAECGSYEEFFYFCETFPLGEYMFEWLERRERVMPDEAIKRVISLLKVLMAAHRDGIFHGRVTPKSLLLERTGEAFSLRLMGLGIAQVIPPSRQFDLDWFNYSFDLEGMDAIAVDIYGVAIILMGLVCGESGIDSFEATGLLPQPFRAGLLQQAMERALSLRPDAYATLLAFSQDLEVALLELDTKKGEMYIGDLVGFESAVRSVTSITKVSASGGHTSGEWSNLVDHLEGEERSSLLVSLTSLATLPVMKEDEDEDEDVTHVTSLPEAVLGMRRIHAKHMDEASSEDKRVRKLRAEAGHHDDEEALTNRSASYDKMAQKNAALSDGAVSGLDMAASESGLNKSSSCQVSNIQIAEALADDCEYDDEEEGPTRIMARPNYYSVSVSPKKEPEEKKETHALVSSLVSENISAFPLAEMKERIRKAEVKVAENEIGLNILYDEPEVEAPAQANETILPPLPPTQSLAPEGSSTHLNRRQKRMILKIVTICLVLMIFLLMVGIVWRYA